MTWQIATQARDQRMKVVSLGLWSSLVAIHVFGLTDAIALGSKVGLYYWWNLGLIAATYRLTVSH
jgi:hypothetical protein